MTDETRVHTSGFRIARVLDELRSREPIFHTERFGRSLEDFERGTAPDFWEVGASGRRYSREFILEMRSREALVDADVAGWKAQASDCGSLDPIAFCLPTHSTRRDASRGEQRSGNERARTGASCITREQL